MKRTYRRNSKIKDILLEYVSNNAKTYLILLIIFFIGVVLGIFFVNNAKETQANQISSYINNFINGIKENYQISKTKLLTTSIVNNLCITLILWFLGSTVIGVPLIYLVIGYKGYCIRIHSIICNCHNRNRKRHIIYRLYHAITKHYIHTSNLNTSS